MLRPPRSVVVGGVRWSVKCRKLETDHLGQTELTKRAIRYVDGQRLDVELDTVLHEVLHALGDAHGIPWGHKGESGYDAEEAIVRVLTPALLQLLRKNPTLIEYLTQPCKLFEE